MFQTAVAYHPHFQMGYPYPAPPAGYYHRLNCSPQLPPHPLRNLPAPVSNCTAITPTYNDVLLGRGGKNNLHPGNEKLRELARAKASEYQKADKKEKSNMSIELIAQVRSMSPPARFLKRNPKTLTWHVVTDDLAREKACQCLRDAVSKSKKRGSFSSSQQHRRDHLVQLKQPQKPSHYLSPTPRVSPKRTDRMDSYDNSREMQNKRRHTDTKYCLIIDGDSSEDFDSSGEDSGDTDARYTIRPGHYADIFENHPLVQSCAQHEPTATYNTAISNMESDLLSDGEESFLWKQFEELLSCHGRLQLATLL